MRAATESEPHSHDDAGDELAVVDHQRPASQSTADDGNGEPARRTESPMSAPKLAIFLVWSLSLRWLCWPDGWDFEPTIHTRPKPSGVNICKWRGRAR